ncbi:hypothetical protein [Bradyrhizobium sp. McL0616]|uniref:hypothetical protein n=1 Tax=Bradyrhizobium sp. McL0616 TaxID=3415674 RepID=UPI003CFAFEC7
MLKLQVLKQQIKLLCQHALTHSSTDDKDALARQFREASQILENDISERSQRTTSFQVLSSVSSAKNGGDAA